MEEKLSQQPEVKSPNRTFLLILGLIIVTVTLLSIALLPKKANTPVSKNFQTQRQEKAKTTLTLSPEAVKDSDGFYNLNVFVDSDTNKLTGSQLELTYDPKAVTIVDIVPGQFFQSPNVLLKKIDQTNGRITYAVATGLGQPGIAGKGTVATIKFKTNPGQKLPLTISFGFLPKTEVSSEETIESVLRKTVDTKLTISSSSN
jgi:hypothetical protein